MKECTMNPYRTPYGDPDACADEFWEGKAQADDERDYEDDED